VGAVGAVQLPLEPAALELRPAQAAAAQQVIDRMVKPNS